MKKKTQKILSFLMSAVMTVSALSLANFSSFAEITDSVSEESMDTSNSELEYGGIFGSLLGDEINESVKGNEEEQNRDYTVYKITHDPEKAYVGVDYHALTECTLFVGFYDDEGTQLVSSITTDLEEAANGHVDLTVLDVLPDHYLIKAFIVGKQFREPLSKPAEYNKQTKKMQEILSTTTEDFDEDAVVNLDKNINNNFVVLQEGVIDITPTETTDIYKYEDEDESGNYKFENAVEIAKLKKGDKAFVRSSPHMIAFVVDDIIVDGTDVVITPSSDVDVGEIIKFIKMDSSEYTGNNHAVIKNDEDSNLEYVEENKVSYPRTLDSESENKDPYALNYPTIDSFDDLHDVEINVPQTMIRFTFELKGKPESASSNVDTDVFGSVNVSALIDMEIYYDFGLKPFLSIQGSADLSVEISGGIDFSINKVLGQDLKVFTPKMIIYTLGVASISYKPEVTFSVKAKFYLKISRRWDFVLGNDIHFETRDPIVEKMDGSLIITIKFGGKIGIDLLCFTVVSVTPYLGLEIVIKDPNLFYTNDTYDRDYVSHDCINGCVQFDFTFIIGVDLDLDFLRTGKLKSKWTLAQVRIPLGTVHLNDEGFGEGPCKNYSHKIAFTVKSKKTGKPISGVKFYAISKNGKELKTYDFDGSAIETDTDGKASFWEKDSLLTDKKYQVLAVAHSGESATIYVGKDFDVESKSQQVFPVEIKLQNEITSSSDTDEDKEKEYDNNSEYVENKHPIFWLGYDNRDDVFMQVFPEIKTAYIYGEGWLNGSKYEDQVDSEYKKLFNKVVFLSENINLEYAYFHGFDNRYWYNVEYFDLSSLNIESLPDALFSGHKKVKEIKLPDTLKRLGRYAFQSCSCLEYIELPSNLETIDYEAFYQSGIKKIDCPSSLKTIETYAFEYCDKLEEIYLNYGLEEIGEWAFAGSGIKSINIPETVNKSDKGMCYSCKKIKTIILNSSNFLNCDYMGYDYHFANLPNLENVILNDGVTKLSKYCFTDCPNLKYIRFSNNLNTISQNAFSFSGITSITIPENVTHIEQSAFAGGAIDDLEGKYGTVKDITILNPECVLEPSIIHTGPEYRVHGYRGSTAEDYAKRMNNTFIPLDPVEEVTTTTAQTTTTTITTVTAVASTVVAPDSECVFMIVNEDKAVPDEADELLDESNLYYFDQETADENGTVKFGYVPDNTIDRIFIFISEVVNDSIKEISRSVGKPGDMKTTVYTQTVPSKEEKIVFGDTNGDGEIDMSDAVLIMQSISNPNKYGLQGTADTHITEAGKKNADVYDPGSGITSMDALAIQRYLMGIYDTLPVYKNS